MKYHYVYTNTNTNTKIKIFFNDNKTETVFLSQLNHMCEYEFVST